MIVFLENVLSAAHVDAFVKALDDVELFESGTRTAGSTAKSQKQNLQALNARPEVAGMLKQIREDLTRHSVFNSFALPARLGRLTISRYETGMQYGTHFDDAFIDGVRTDLSVTLFLSDPDTYSGGELELTTPSGSQAIKLPSGCAIVYPSDHLHAVLPVTDGVRLAAVGWVQSRIRSSSDRQLLFELHEATQQLEAGGVQNAEALLKLKYVRNNLIRKWSD